MLKMSFGCQAKISLPTRLEPVPSTTTPTALLVVRYGMVSAPASTLVMEQSTTVPRKNRDTSMA
jgi:hypothetical protein